MPSAAIDARGRSGSTLATATGPMAGQVPVNVNYARRAGSAGLAALHASGDPV